MAEHGEEAKKKVQPKNKNKSKRARRPAPQLLFDEFIGAFEMRRKKKSSAGSGFQDFEKNISAEEITEESGKENPPESEEAAADAASRGLKTGSGGEEKHGDASGTPESGGEKENTNPVGPAKLTLTVKDKKLFVSHPEKTPERHLKSLSRRLEREQEHKIFLASAESELKGKDIKEKEPTGAKRIKRQDRAGGRPYRKQETKTENMQKSNKRHFSLPFCGAGKKEEFKIPDNFQPIGKYEQGFSLYTKRFSLGSLFSKTAGLIILGLVIIFILYKASGPAARYIKSLTGRAGADAVTAAAAAPAVTAKTFAKKQDLSLKEKEWKEMIAGVKEIMAERRKAGDTGPVGAYIKDLSTGRTWTQSPGMQFRAASLIKVPLMASVMYLIDNNFELKNGERLTLDTEIKYTKQLWAGGSGTLRKTSKYGDTFKIRDLLYIMITESDNTAAKMLTDTIGFQNIENAFKALGFKDTNICRSGMNLTSYKIKEDNYTTPNDIAGMFEKIYRGKLVSAKASSFMLGILKHVELPTRLRKALPEGWGLAHKTGLLRQACHDAGIVYSPRGEFIIVLLTSNSKNYKEAQRFITTLGAETYKYYALERIKKQEITAKQDGYKTV